jgi:putative sterol carrier protein
MSKTAGFFNEYLPNKIEKNPDLATSVAAVFQFNITGAGEWYADLKDANIVAAGTHDTPDCVITVAQQDWEDILENPGSAVGKVMTGKLKVSNLGQATKLQKLLA